ncbi:hypothetical protein BX600DRAFT_459593 [Xylariales sp. PMI_506]|nr:hypothetical protein BX600DRAFT_459593 [Xylariales sp. PMI_506]
MRSYFNTFPEVTYSVPSPMHQFPDCLAPIPRPSSTGRQIARLISQALRSYPIMMLRRETFPPFIHPHWHRSTLPVSLANCMGMAHIFASRSTETRPFLWYSIKAETKRFLDEMDSYSGEETLAAIQAQTIYLIMRVVDEATEPAELNLDILRVFKLLCARYQAMLHPALDEIPDKSWQHWLYEESKKRTAIVFYLIALIVSINTGISCNAVEQYRDIPLCSAKTIWEARTDIDWVTECQEYATQIEPVPFDTLGHLIDAQDSNITSPKGRALDRWNARTDNLGSLLNTAALASHKVM